MSAVTGVRAHQTMLDVTGNNIANVNTTGFKKDFTVFQDLLYQTTKSASGPGDARGGVDPSQVGLGVQVAAIETIHTQGPAQYTGNNTDMMISGQGYFVFRDGQSRLYSRAGNFIVDSDLNLVHSGTGYRVQGYQMERDPLNPLNFIKSSELTDINIPMGKKMEARATTVVGYKCNLDSRSGVYLPIGYEDIPFAGNGKAAQITMGGNPYTLTVVTSSTAANYLTYNFGTGSTSVPLTFSMVGIDDSGMPILSSTYLTPGTNLVLPGNLSATVSYDNTTGALKLTSPIGGSTLWETNVRNKMTYSSFKLTNTDPTTGGEYKFIAEFDEKNLTTSPVTMNLWWQDPDPALTPPANMNKVVVSVPIKSDGTFDVIDWATAVKSGTLPPGFGTSDLGADGKLNFQMVRTASGSGLEIQARDPYIGGASLASVGQITMGGFHATKVDVYDCKGDKHTLEVVYKKVSENTWRWEAFFPNEPELMAYRPSGEIVFGSCGQIVSPDSVDIEVPFSLIGAQNQTITLDFSGKSFGLDALSGITQYASETTTKPYYQDGYTMGVLNDFSVAQDGTINGIYSNGQTLPIYRIALAQFANPMGLEKVGNTMFRETVNSGMARIDAALADGAGTITQGSLEASNVDLTEEFTHLIIAQRGFQANTRVVTVSDQILEEVVNMKR